MDELTPRLRAVCDLDVAEVREFSGRHEYDGRIQDLSPDGVRSGLARMADGRGRGPPARRPVRRGASGRVRATPPGSVSASSSCTAATRCCTCPALDLACYEREYAPQQERDAARSAHLAQWPEAIDAAIATLDQLSAPVAAALADGVRGLPAGIPATAGDRVRRDALAAHTRLVAHIDQAVADGAARRRAGRGGARRADEQRRARCTWTWAGSASGPTPSGTGCTDAAGGELRADRPGPPRAGGGPRTGPRSSRCRRCHRGRPRAGRSGPSSSPGTATWCPTTTASAWSGWPRSRGAGPWR